MVSWWSFYFKFNYISDVDTIFSDRNNEINDYVKNIKVGQNDLDKMHTTESNISIEQNKGKNLNILKFKKNMLY